jgi:hypothetical protein
MLGHLKMSARQRGPLVFELALSILNPEGDALTAIWNIELPHGITEPRGRTRLMGRTVVPARREIEANYWEIVVASTEVYAYRQIVASADFSLPDRHSSDELRASVAQIRVD